MDYFLELTDHEDEFYVHHSKLIEYGVMTSTQSTHILEKLNTLRLVENEEYRLTDIREPVKQGGYTVKKVYYLTPDSSKVRAKLNVLGLIQNEDYRLADVR